MNETELKPVGKIHYSSFLGPHVRLEFDADPKVGGKVYAIPDTHRVVSVELLTTIEKAFVDYEMAVGDAPPYPHLKMMKELRAIIDSKGEESNDSV